LTPISVYAYGDLVGDPLRALADPRRQSILRLIRSEERSVGEIADSVGIAQPTATEHLRVLRDAGLARERRDGTRRFYRASPDGMQLLVEQLEELWGGSLRRLKRSTEQARRGSP
jgi:DNA-binding transcriptional ArsR family regulator